MLEQFIQIICHFDFDIIFKLCNVGSTPVFPVIHKCSIQALLNGGGAHHIQFENWSSILSSCPILILVCAESYDLSQILKMRKKIGPISKLHFGPMIEYLSFFNIPMIHILHCDDTSAPACDDLLFIPTLLLINCCAFVHAFWQCFWCMTCITWRGFFDDLFSISSSSHVPVVIGQNYSWIHVHISLIPFLLIRSQLFPHLVVN